MKLLISKDELKKKKSREKVPCRCHCCDETFYVTKSYAQRGLIGSKQIKCCSRKCASKLKTNNSLVILKCQNCGEKFKRRRFEVKKHRRSRFCSLSCANIYNGKKKNIGFMWKICIIVHHRRYKR